MTMVLQNSHSYVAPFYDQILKTSANQNFHSPFDKAYQVDSNK